MTVANDLTLFEPIDKNKVKSQIYEIRGMRVMLDKDIAVYFGVTTGNLNKAMKRNIKRFPPKFCFMLTKEEYREILRFQTGILELEQGKYSKYMPYAYTEHGISMLTSPTQKSNLSHLRGEFTTDISLLISEWKTKNSITAEQAAKMQGEKSRQSPKSKEFRIIMQH